MSDSALQRERLTKVALQSVYNQTGSMKDRTAHYQMRKVTCSRAPRPNLLAQPVITVIFFAPQLNRHMVENINQPGVVLNVIATNNMAHSEEIATGLLIT